MTHLSSAELGTVLSVWAHPDDEAYLAGGLLGALVDAGQRAVCVTATRGEAADPTADAAARAALASVRSSELESALEVLGVEEHHWLDLPDGGLADADPEGPVGRLASLVDTVRPDTVLTFGPDGFTGHPDHRAVSRWTERALDRADHAADVRLLHAVTLERLIDREIVDSFGVYDLGEPRYCTDEELAVRLSLSGRELERKVRALLAQRSQTAGLVAALGHDRFAAWVATECFAPPAITG